MGLFNTGKNDKAEKVSKYERQYNVADESSRHRPSKHGSKGKETPIRAISQPPLMRFPGTNVHHQSFYPGMIPFNSPMNIRYPMIPFDLSKYSTGTGFNGGIGMSPINAQSFFNNPFPMVNQQTSFQQGPWPIQSTFNYPFFQNMQF